MDFTLLTGLSAILFFTIAAAEPLAARLKLPFAIVLCIIGAGLGLGAIALLNSSWASEMGWEARRALRLGIPSQLFLSIFLPTLIFQVALSLDIRRMMEDWVAILMMAVLAVIVATLVVGATLAPISGLSLYACLLIGAIISTTDPSAVIDIFRSISAPPRLVRIIQGESLLNDATAIALFSFFLAFVTSGTENPALSSVLLDVPVTMFGGLLGGWLVARLAIPLLAVMRNWVMAQVTLTLVIPFCAYLLAEHFGCSGVIATFAAGLTLNLAGPVRLTPVGWSNIRNAWDVMAHWAGGLIFLLAALQIPKLLGDATLVDVGLVAAAVVAALVARALILWGVLPLLSRLRLSPPISTPFRIAILWGGLRGAVTLALALAVIEAPMVPDDVKRLVGILSTGYVLSVFVLQGLTLRPLIRLLGLDRMAPLDQALSSQVIAVALQDVREEVAAQIKDRGIEHEVVRSEAKRLGEVTQAAVGRAESAREVLDSERVTLGLIALASHERDLVLDSAKDGRIGPELQQRMTMDASRLLEKTRTGGRSGYRAAVREAFDGGVQLRLAAMLHRRLRISGPLAALTAERIEVLIAQRAILQDLGNFTQARIRRIHGKRVTEILCETLTKREERVQALLEGLHLQYPGYAEEIERRWIRRMALRLQEKEYAALLADSLIDAALHKTLMDQIATERQALSRRPRLDMGAQKDVLLRRLDLFKDLDRKAISRLARALHVRHVEPGELLQARDAEPGTIWLIGSGAAEVHGKAGVYRIGPGDFFGHISVLTRAPRKAEIKALTHGTLFALEETRFRKLMKANTSILQHVIDGGTRAGVQIDKEMLAGPGAQGRKIAA